MSLVNISFKQAYSFYRSVKNKRNPAFSNPRHFQRFFLEAYGQLLFDCLKRIELADSDILNARVVSRKDSVRADMAFRRCLIRQGEIKLRVAKLPR